MPVYAYKAFTSSGSTVTGELAAHSPEELRHLLAGKGMMLQNARQVRWRGGNLLPQKSVKGEELLLFNQEFIALIRAGIPIPSILEMLEQRPGQPVLQRVIARVRDEIQKGAPLSQACADHPEVFDSLYLTSLKMGEQSGQLARALQRYQQYLQLRLDIQKKVRQALAYPIFLLITLVVALLILFTFVLPRFVSIYTDFDAALPLPTQVLMHVVDHLYLYLPIALAVVVAGTLGYRIWVRSDRGRLQRDSLWLRLPIMRQVIRMHVAGQVSRMLSTLLGGGMPLVEALASTAESVDNRVYSLGLWQVRQQVTEGEPLNEAMAQLDLFEPTTVKIIQAGETAGNLDQMLGEVADYQESILEHRLSRLMALIEPALLLIMLIFIGGIIIAMYLPIFSLAEVIK
jgi:type IV pilus assembly protein PilC